MSKPGGAGASRHRRVLRRAAERRAMKQARTEYFQTHQMIIPDHIKKMSRSKPCPTKSSAPSKPTTEHRSTPRS